MSAIFYNYSGSDMFKTSTGTAATPIYTDLFDGLVADNSNLCILTQIGVTNVDMVQFFTTFDDFVHYYYFGAGVGSVTVSGMLFMDCDNDMPGIDALYTAIGDKRGDVVTVTLGSYGFTGVMMDCNLTVVAEPETMISFTVNFGMIAHNLPGGKNA